MPKRLTISEFKKLASARFKNKFDYSKVNFIHTKEPAPIICPTHGEFLQVPFLHLKSKNGCRRCAGVGKKTTAEFIKEAKYIHGDKYSYRKVNYKNSKEKVIITCKIHGDFKISPVSHVSKRAQGCKYCGMADAHKKMSMGKKEFIRKAREIHGDKYDYSKVEYIDSTTNVTIICNKSGHGVFNKFPANHLKKTNPQGCPVCSRERSSKNRRKDTPQFVKQAMLIHGDKYQYHLVNYIRKDLPVSIVCRKHGNFSQEANSHLRGTGCPMCAGKNKLDNESFARKSRITHGNKYNYTKVNYVNSTTKVTITCTLPGHGDFQQRPGSHIRGMEGCSDCHGKGKLTEKNFIKKAKTKHGNKFDYSKVNFKSRFLEVTIICPSHGEFLQKPSNHIRSGCPTCGGSSKLSTDGFIAKAKNKHGDIYDYSDTKYLLSNAKVAIKCPYHGLFKQLARHHLGGAGCPHCHVSRGENKIEKYLKQFGLDYTYQHTFSDCINVKELRFDFSITVLGVLGLIEFHGEQHYMEVSHFHGSRYSNSLRKTMENDSIKEDFCKENDIPLLVIKYDQFDAIDLLLKNFIQKLKA